MTQEIFYVKDVCECCGLSYSAAYKRLRALAKKGILGTDVDEDGRRFFFILKENELPDWFDLECVQSKVEEEELTESESESDSLFDDDEEDEEDEEDEDEEGKYYVKINGVVIAEKDTPFTPTEAVTKVMETVGTELELNESDGSFEGSLPLGTKG